MKLVILDRDGVINEDSDDYVKSPDEWIPIPGSLEAIGRLTGAGFTVAVASNQSGLARGLFDRGALDAMHAKMADALAGVGGRVDVLVYCPHGPDDDCVCRKPKPGLLLQISARLNAALDGVPAIGDSLRDLQAAAAVGARPLLVLTGKGKRTLADGTLPAGTLIYADLAACVDALLATEVLHA